MCDESVLPERTLKRVFEKFGFGLPAGEKLIGYPVAGHGNDTRPGHRAYNFVCYRPANEAALVALLTDADGSHYQGGIHPTKSIGDRLQTCAKPPARKPLAPQFAEMIEKTAQPFFVADRRHQIATIGFGRCDSRTRG